jgi:hypothetical protein
VLLHSLDESFGPSSPTDISPAWGGRAGEETQRCSAGPHDTLVVGLLTKVAYDRLRLIASEYLLPSSDRSSQKCVPDVKWHQLGELRSNMLLSIPELKPCSTIHNRDSTQTDNRIRLLPLSVLGGSLGSFRRDPTSVNAVDAARTSRYGNHERAASAIRTTNLEAEATR